jgi:hypothetical protein
LRISFAGQQGWDQTKVEDVEAILLFSGDSGLFQVEVILVVDKVQRKIVGVYKAEWGR